MSRNGREMIIRRPDPGNAGQFLNVCGVLATSFQITNAANETVKIDCQNRENAPSVTRTAGRQDRAFSGSGTFEDEENGRVVALAAENNEVLTGYQVYVPGFGVWTGDWLVTSFQFTGNADDPLAFSFDVAQAGKPAFAPEV